MCDMATQMLGDLEKEIMEVMWANNQPLTVRIVYEAISKRRKIAYTTVMTIMGRLVKKGTLSRKVESKDYLYQPKVSKDKFIGKAAHRIFSSAVSTFGEEVLTHFMKEIQKLSPQKRQKLLKILNKDKVL